jgi:hypothetical protein
MYEIKTNTDWYGLSHHQQQTKSQMAIEKGNTILLTCRARTMPHSTNPRENDTVLST